MLALLDVAQMYRADKVTIDSGTPGFTLMQEAGAGIARAIQERFSPCRVTVLAGPGNNGGDGFIVARDLKAAGWAVTVALLGGAEKVKGDAAQALQQWHGPVVDLAPGVVDAADLIVDALFGAGLDRPVTGRPAAVIAAVEKTGLPVVAVDIPSGIHGDTGQVMGIAIKASMTITFFRKKPGHVLMPGRRFAGDVRVIDIGIPDRVLETDPPDTFENAPALWFRAFPAPDPQGHKYSRGHAVVMSGGPDSTGAARLAARAALRAGAGLVTVTCPPNALAINAGHLTAVMTRAVADIDAFRNFLADERRNAVLLGPGNGVSDLTRDRVLAALSAGKDVVLDADALTVFADDRDTLFAAITAATVLTPHMGEFRRLFPDVAEDAAGKLTMARCAAEMSGAVVLLKGPDTVVAAPGGRASITANAPPTLATAGAGDTLAGIILGLMAQGMPPFEAASAAAWLQGAAARRFGPGLIAEDISEMLPAVLGDLAESVPIPNAR